MWRICLLLLLQHKATDSAGWKFWEREEKEVKKQPPQQHYQQHHYHLQPQHHNSLEPAQPRSDNWVSSQVIGDWVAQWDTEFQQWFFYNQVTDESTWEQPRELQQLEFSPPPPGVYYDYYGDYDPRQPVPRQAEFPVVNPSSVFCGLLDPRPECQTTAPPPTTTTTTTTVSTTTGTTTTTTTTTTTLDAIQLLKRDKPLGPGGRYNGIYDAIYGIYSKFFELLYVDLRIEW